MTLASIFSERFLEEDSNSHTSTEMITARIRSAIIEGLLPTGFRLREVELASLMKASRTPIREAFRILQSEGYLEHVPRCGVVVAGLHKDEVSQFWELRSILESTAAAKAAVNITDGQLELLLDLQDRMETLPPTLHAEYTQLDRDWHHLIAKASGNAKLEDSIARLWHMTSLGRTRSTLYPERVIASREEHKNVTQAISLGDAVLAQRYGQIHFENSLKAILAIQNSFKLDTANKE